ncbi:response regulator [Alkalicoccobacillus gibsonii]|uniref:Response regulator n=1 Tax=Alkalicoccobacillus gibsonii TaxID=79881 RepID=A0ABU9VME1_9BACI|nr:response regulator [Alkalicoccobacillus gibsonii]
MISYCIIDDHKATRRMIEQIIEDAMLGTVVGSSSGGSEGIELVLSTNPHMVLIDLLMPELDGIGMISELKARGYNGKFVMISQIDNKDMVGEAYKMGVEFFIHKPINMIEVESVLNRINMQFTVDRSLLQIRQSLANLEQVQPMMLPSTKSHSARDTAQNLLMDMGLLGERGSQDLLQAIELLIELELPTFPPLKTLYSLLAKEREPDVDPVRESKAIEQRIRRTVAIALSNMASVGLTDYANPRFEYYAPLFFDFQDVRLRMQELEKETEQSRVKTNVKKFIQVLFWETQEKMKGAQS